MYGNPIKTKALILYIRGFSYEQISDKLGIAKSTLYYWILRSLDEETRNTLKKSNNKRALIKAYEAVKKKRKRLVYETKRAAKCSATSFSLDKNTSKILCSLLLWAEGEKNTKCVRFTNSDPKMIRTFLKLFRTGWHLDEAKLRVTLHLHKYHNELVQVGFWSSVTGIPVTQFNKSWVKQSTGTRKKVGYGGCARISYCSNNIALELKETYNALAKRICAEGAW